MSATPVPSPEPRDRTCDRTVCADEYPEGGGHQGYCSRRCWSIAKASDCIRGVRFDHQFCANCYRRIRTVIPPGRAANSTDKHKDVPECAIGWAIPEHDTITADGEVLTMMYRPHPEITPTDETSHRQICSCGVTHHATIERSTLTKAESRQHATRLFEALADRRDRGAHDYDPDLEEFREAVLTLKSRPELARNDGLIFRHGLAVALRCSHE